MGNNTDFILVIVFIQFVERGVVLDDIHEYWHILGYLIGSIIIKILADFISKGDGILGEGPVYILHKDKVTTPSAM